MDRGKTAVGIIEILREVLARDAEFGLSGMSDDCGCASLSRAAEREYETGECPHQRARAAIRALKGNPND